jgi:hypothetical protein
MIHFATCLASSGSIRDCPLKARTSWKPYQASCVADKMPVLIAPYAEERSGPRRWVTEASARHSAQHGLSVAPRLAA